MPWDRGYYYRAVRVDGRPRRVYVGGGMFAHLVADADANERDARLALADQLRRLRAQDAAWRREIDGQYRALRGLVGAALTAAGCYQHNREWRRMDVKAFAKRYREAGEREAAAGEAAHSGGEARLAGGDDAGAPGDDVEALVKRLNGPKPSRADLDALRAVLAMPAGAKPSVLDGQAMLGHVLGKYGGGEASQLVMRADADRMAKSLGRDDAPPFERPLIDHIVVCWVRLQLVERDHANATSGSHRPETGAYWDRRLSEAQRRYLRAVNLLAKLRHLGPAQVQVNVANQQVVMNGDK